MLNWQPTYITLADVKVVRGQRCSHNALRALRCGFSAIFLASFEMSLCSISFVEEWFENLAKKMHTDANYVVMLLQI
jgi:hypothetical protein